MIYNRKIEVEFSKEDAVLLDDQSKICNWLYNQLLSICEEDRKNNNGAKKLLSGRNLRNYSTAMKQDNRFLYKVHSSPLKNTAIRLKESYDRFFSKQCGHPKFRSWKKKWFSLFYDEPDKGFKVLNNKFVQISLGEKKCVKGTFKESLTLNNNERIKTFRLCKQRGNKFFAIFTIEAADTALKPINNWIAIDQNHKNFFVAHDDKGITFEFAKLYQTKYWDTIIDELKSKRDKCNRRHKRKTTEYGGKYYVPNKRWVKLNSVLDKAYRKRDEQVKHVLYKIAHFIAKNYDHVIIGDYVPSKQTATEDKMHRSMLNQEHIGYFRQILSWVMKKSGKTFTLVDEENTTKECCTCGYMEKKLPDVRDYTCPKCNTFMLRDNNSAVNMAKKVNLKPSILNLQKVDKVGRYNFYKQRLVVC